MHEIEINRNSHLIDPQLHIWGWEVPVYLFLGGITAGIMVFSAILAMKHPREERSTYSRWFAFLAPVLLSIGMFTLLLDLEYKLHVWRFYAAFRVTSPMSWGSWILLAIYPATLFLGLASLTREEVERIAGWKLVGTAGMSKFLGPVYDWVVARTKSIAWFNIVLGIALGVYTGVLLGTLGARAAWNSSLLGPLFLVSGVSTGAAVMMLFPIKHAERVLLRRWDIGAILVEMALLLLFLLTLMTGGGEEGRRAATMFLGGEFTALFWSLVVIAGLAVPLILETVEIVRRRRPTMLAPVLLLVGGLSLRWILVLAGQA